VGSSPKPYLTFRVARQDLAMEAACVRGILPLTDLEPAADGRSGLLGITSLKGQVVGVIDLRSRLQLPQASEGSQPKIVVLELTAGTRQHLLGFVADRISDVVVYRDRDLRNGALRGKGRPRKLVDFDQLVSDNELAAWWALSP
jgi:chemotaxis signal transduction protein